MTNIDNQIETIVKKYNCRDVMKLKNKIRMIRPDGFVIYLDRIKANDPNKHVLIMLNKVRLTKTPIEVMLAVGFVRGAQISQNYAQSYSRKDIPKLQKILVGVFNSALTHKQVK